MQKKPSIGIIAGVVPSTTFIERLVNGLAGSGYRVYHFGVKNGVFNYSENVIPVSYPNSKLGKLLYYIKCWLLLSLYKGKQKERLDNHLKAQGKYYINHLLRVYPVLLKSPDIVHVQWAKTIEDWMWVQDFGMKLVLSLRGAHINYSPLANKALAESYRINFPKIDGFHAVSKAISVEAQKYSAPPKRIKVVYSGLEVPRDIKINKTFNHRLHILSVGRDHWKKGYSYALDAMAKLKHSGIDLTYTIVGAAESVELLYQIKDLDLESTVKLLPQMTFKKVKQMMKAADLLVLSSVEEGVANVVLEAMAIGTPVVSTDCGGMTEVLTDGENGFVIPARDAEAIANKIHYILQLTSDEIHTIVINAHNTIKENHSVDKMINGMARLYELVGIKTIQEDE